MEAAVSGAHYRRDVMRVKPFQAGIPSIGMDTGRTHGECPGTPHVSAQSTGRHDCITAPLR
jgi:hypothetical protein